MSLTKASFSMITGTPINVLDYGADPTGVASSVTAFQNAIAAALAQKKAVYLPAGTYLIDSPVNDRANPYALFTMYGEGASHSGLSFTPTGKAVIDMTGNTQYAFACGYALRMSDFSVRNGTDFINWNSSGLDANTTYLNNIECYDLAGAFFKVYNAGNGSQIIMDNCQFVDYGNIPDNIATFCVFDNLTEDVSTDSLTMTGCWIETYSTATFKLGSVRFQLDNTRLVPYQAPGYWITAGVNSEAPAQIHLNNTDFGGENSGRMVLLAQESGVGVTATDCGIFCASLGTRRPFNFEKAPSRIIFNDCVGFVDTQLGVINFDSAMSNAEKAKLNQTVIEYNRSFSNTNINAYFSNPGNLSFASVAKQPDFPINRVCTTSDLIATVGSPWVTSVNSSGVASTTLIDSIGDAGFESEFEVTSATGSVDILWTTDLNISTLPNGNYTLEFYVTATDLCKARLVATENSSVTYELAAGCYQLTLPFTLGTDNTRRVGVGLSAALGTKFAVSRGRVWKGFHLTRQPDIYGSAAPSGASNAWFVGDRVINNAPTAGQPKAWICTVAGTPGTWVSEGNL